MTAVPDVSQCAAPEIDFIVESPLWRAAPDAEILLRRAITAAATAAKSRIALAVVLTDDSTIRALNKRWRGQDKPTNVLSFPARANGADDVSLGDIVLAFETAEREAASEKIPLRDHLSHLAVHGFLHLLGYDHETDDEADVMERFESSILAQLDVPDPYKMRDAGA